jgi:glucuronate isomerase
MSSLHLDPDRALPFPAEQRSIAGEIYGETKELPLVCMHGHVEPEVFADDLPFADPAQLLIVPDHYVFRMLASQGIEPARLGVPRLDDGPVETDSRTIWRTFCENWKLFRGTPSRYWLEHELVEVFGVDQVPSAETADAIYDQIAACVADAGFRPRALLDRFNIEVISTTDSATSDLGHHAKLAADGLGERVLPTFRPDSLAYFDRPTWRTEIAELANLSGIDTTTYDGFLDALRSRRAAFVEAGARATDHGHLLADSTPMEKNAARELYARVLGGAQPSQSDVDAFAANMLYQMAEMTCEDGLVMQIHPGVLRNHNTAIGNSYGPDKGYDIPIQTEFTRALRPMLDQSGPIRGCASSSSPSTRLCTAGNWPRLPVRILRFDWAHRGGSWTPPRECAGSGSPPPRPPASQHLRLCGRHTGVRVHTRSARPLPSRRCRLSRAFGPGASAQPGRGGGDGHRPGVPPAQGVISAALTHYGPAVF